MMDDREKLKGGIIFLASIGIIAIILLNASYLAAFNWAAMGYLGVFLIMLLTSATVIIPIPGLAAATVAGAFSNPLLLGIAGGIGSAIGESTGYMLGYGGGEIIDGKRLNKYMEIKRKFTEGKEGFLLIFLLALIPNPLFDIAGIAAGTVKYPLWRFLAATALGKIIKVMMFAYLGYWIAGMM